MSVRGRGKFLVQESVLREKTIGFFVCFLDHALPWPGFGDSHVDEQRIVDRSLEQNLPISSEDLSDSF